MQHPNGPELPEEAKSRHFRSYDSLANWANEANLPYGIYFVRNLNAKTLAGIREVNYNPGSFYVWGVGNI